MADYAAFGIRFYWIVDPRQRTFEVYERDADGAYIERVRTSSATVEDIPACPGLALDLDLMWTQVDTLDN
jgi:Uma2 family endonuclease